MKDKFGIVLFLFISANAGIADAQPFPLHLIKLPPNFQIELYAFGVENARSMTMSPNGTLYVGTRTAGNVYAVIDDDKNLRADRILTIARAMRAPNGVAFKDGNLYIAEVNRIWRFDEIEDNLPRPAAPTLLFDHLPNDGHHGWKFIRFGPDGKLYIPVGAPCNVCERQDDRYGSILRIDQDGGNWEVYARGVRNTVGFDWHPQTEELWFTDNGRDNLGDDLPPDELNHAPMAGLHFGFPYCHGQSIKDPEFGGDHSCDEFEGAAQELGPHVASLGMRFYTGKMFPEQYHQQIFIAEHGSWNRSKKIGYRIMLVRLEDNRPVNYEVFAEGWKVGERIWGRPVDLQIMPDGSLLVSDDYAGAIYRISYNGNQ